MARKHPSGDQIQAMLKESHFGESLDLPPADPVTTTQMLVEIDRIEPYNRNPRKERNPRYDEIKESIRAQGGLNNPLTITRRPGDTYYMVESGGNTRLQILKELWRETRDERFQRIHSLFRPWVSDAHVLTAHLIENDKRGDLIFIDKAVGVRELRQIIEADAGQPLSLRQLVEELQLRGYGLDLGTLSRMDYAVETLLPLIPEALRGGLGRPQISRICRLESVCRRCWCDQTGDDDSGRFDALFADVLSIHDGPEWDLDSMQRELEARLAEALDLSIKRVRLELDARLAGRVSVREVQPAPVAEVSTDAPVAANPGQSPSTVDVTVPQAPSSPPPPSEHRAPTDGHTEVDATRPAQPAPVDNAPAPETPREPSQGPTDLKSLRNRSYDLALEIAGRHAMEHCIAVAPALGMGYLVDLPDEPLVPVPGEDAAINQLYRQWVWWLLVSLSEEVVHPERLARLPSEMVLRNLVLEKHEEQVLALVGEPDWKALGYEFLSNPSVDEQTFSDLLDLAQNCRRIRRLVNDDGGLVLWQNDG